MKRKAKCKGFGKTFNELSLNNEFLCHTCNNKNYHIIKIKPEQDEDDIIY